MELRRYDANNKFENKWWWGQGRQILLKNLVAKLNLNPKAKILDLGCGTGFTLLNLKKFGQVYGADISPEALDFCKKKGLTNLTLIKENQKLPFKTNTFNLITCLDVLEHVNDDLANLKETKRILKPDGFLIVFVPATMALWSGLDIQSHHLRRYSKNELSGKVKSAGFTIKKIVYFNWILFWPILIIRLIQRLGFLPKNPKGDEPDIKSEIINKILLAIFTLDVKTASFFNPLFGVSLMAVVKK